MPDINTRVGFLAQSPSATFTRPADTTAYISGDLVANSTTAASVTPLSWTVGTTITPANHSYYVAGVRFRKSGTSTTNASFRVHLYSATPTVATTGDNGVFASVVTGASNWIGSYDVTLVAAHADGCIGYAVPTEGLVAPVISAGNTIYGLVEAQAGYTPANAEVFTLALHMELN